jgi:DNA-binding MurR/RpiR family transcriptional regulator
MENLGTNSSKGDRNGQNSRERKTWTTALESRFAQVEEVLGSRRRDLVRQILDHPEDTYFLTSRALAKFYSVDTATIVRTIQALGYERYADFAADLRAHFLSRITPYTLMKSAARDKRSIADHVEHSLELDAHSLQALRASMSPDEIIKMARIVDRARRVLVVGVDFAAALAHMLAYALVSIGMDAETPVGSTGNLHQKVLVLGPKDLLIALSFGRCLQDTVDSVICASDNGVPTFGITDSEQSPIARFCDHSWNTSVASPAFHESYVAPVAAINALLVACAQLRPERSLANLQRKEQKFRNRWYSPNRGDERKSKNAKVE